MKASPQITPGNIESVDSTLGGVVDALPGVVWTARPDGDLDFLNQYWCEYTGLTASEGYGQGWLAALHADDRLEILERWQAILATGEPREMEARIRRFDGEYRWFTFRTHPVIDASGQVIQWCGVNIDVEERKRSEETLNASEHLFRLIVDNLPTLVSLRSPTGGLEFANRHVLEYVGATLKELQALETTGPVHPEDRPHLLAAWEVAIRTGEPYDIEVRRRRADGVYRWFHSRGFPLRDADGRIVTWYLLGTDIDDRKHAEDALQRAQSELSHVSRMTTLGEFAASIAHEVNQPLGSVINNATACLGLLSTEVPRLEEAREVLREIIEGANRASAVIARVWQLSKKVPFERSVVSLKEVVTDVLVLARYQAEKRQITIRTELAADLPFVLGDRLQLQQVLLNLIVNGMDAMKEIEPSRRSLIISGRSEKLDGEPGCIISVRDTGAGFRLGEIGRLFEAFYSTKPEGMGMGLAISRSIIEAHGGELRAEANEGPGATFLFSLPNAPGFKS